MSPTILFYCWSPTYEHIASSLKQATQTNVLWVRKGLQLFPWNLLEIERENVTVITDTFSINSPLTLFNSMEWERIVLENPVCHIESIEDIRKAAPQQVLVVPHFCYTAYWMGFLIFNTARYYVKRDACPTHALGLYPDRLRVPCKHPILNAHIRCIADNRVHDQASDLASLFLPTLENRMPYTRCFATPWLLFPDQLAVLAELIYQRLDVFNTAITPLFVFGIPSERLPISDQARSHLGLVFVEPAAGHLDSYDVMLSRQSLSYLGLRNDCSVCYQQEVASGQLRFWHIPKTAGESVSFSAQKQFGILLGKLDSSYDQKLYQDTQYNVWSHYISDAHVPASRFEPEVVQQITHENYFVIIRQPIERALSLLNYLRANNNLFRGHDAIDSFVHKMTKPKDPNALVPALFATQKSFVYTENKTRIIKYTLVFETLAKTITPFFAQFGYPDFALEHLNQCTHLPNVSTITQQDFSPQQWSKLLQALSEDILFYTKLCSRKPDDYLTPANF